jgi:hypothetical protein
MGELGQIGPHGDPNGDAAWLAQQASREAGAGTVSGVSYDKMSSNPPTGGAHMNSYDEMKHTGVAC